MGFTLVQNLDDSDDKETQSEVGHESEDRADIVVNRGDADFVVKPDDNRVLRCIERDSNDDASDALKNLFKTNSWKTIQAMDGFDDGSLDFYEEGDIAYARMEIK